jgi:hypothetical protein
VHRLFYADIVVYESDYRACKARLMPIAYVDRDDAPTMARYVNARCGVAWEIETDGGATVRRWQIPREDIELHQATTIGVSASSDVLIALAARERRGDYSRPCGAGYVEPPGAARFQDR